MFLVYKCFLDGMKKKYAYFTCMYSILAEWPSAFVAKIEIANIRSL